MMDQRLHALYVRYAPLVYRRCLSILGNEEEAWDGVQELFLKLAEKNTLLERMESPTAYLWQMATRYSLNRLKPDGRSVSAEQEPLDLRGPTEDDRLRAIFLGKPFSRVSERTRGLAWYRWVDRMTWEETAEASGLSVSGVRKHLAQFSAFVARYKEHV